MVKGFALSSLRVFIACKMHRHPWQFPSLSDTEYAENIKNGLNVVLPLVPLSQPRTARTLAIKGILII